MRADCHIAMIITRNRAFRGRQTDEDICMTQISLTFPDGSARKYNAGITPAVIANKHLQIPIKKGCECYRQWTALGSCLAHRN